MKKQFSTHSVSSEAAHQMITAAERKAVEIGRAHGIVADARRRAAQRSSGAGQGLYGCAAGATAGISQLVIFGGGYTLAIKSSAGSA